MYADVERMRTQQPVVQPPPLCDPQLLASCKQGYSASVGRVSSCEASDNFLELDLSSLPGLEDPSDEDALGWLDKIPSPCQTGPCHQLEGGSSNNLFRSLFQCEDSAEGKLLCGLQGLQPSQQGLQQPPVLAETISAPHRPAAPSVQPAGLHHTGSAAGALQSAGFNYPPAGTMPSSAGMSLQLLSAMDLQHPGYRPAAAAAAAPVSTGQLLVGTPFIPETPAAMAALLGSGAPAAQFTTLLAADYAGSSSVSWQAALSMVGGTHTATTAAAVAGQQAHMLPPLLLGQLVSASSIGSSSAGRELAEPTPGSPAEDVGSVCPVCIALQQACIKLAADCAEKGKVRAASKAVAAEVLVRAAACPRQCLITMQLPTDNSPGEFMISFAKARLADQGGQRAPPGTASSRNFNFRCNAPCEITLNRVSAQLALSDNTKLFAVVSADKKVGMTGIALIRFPADPRAAAEGSPDSPISSSSFDSLWCSRGHTCSKTSSRYQGQEFDLFKYAFFFSSSCQASGSSSAGTKRKAAECD